ncbi:hypothetical protein JD844_031554 [Phrynosoma platyrhinos]|uniref:Anti-proliferative protein domain-containing protein n=1 Tax=Phrynosoma platyrhinos TaxID=52577 RepID=A0ABQ7T1B5_PHRPL|nr:hypothetical protein JD844_031554 [Phrynosoma platyrhinos]
MKDEIAVTVFFITRLVKKYNKLSKHQVEMFASKLMTIMFEKYKNHWYPDNPSKGQAYRYGENNPPFTVAQFEGSEEAHAISQRIRQAVDKASDSSSNPSSDEESSVSEPKSIPTVSNPNSVYQCGEPLQAWSQYTRRKAHVPDGLHQNPASSYYCQYKAYKACRPLAPFSGPRVDRYHWVNANR